MLLDTFSVPSLTPDWVAFSLMTVPASMSACSVAAWSTTCCLSWADVPESACELMEKSFSAEADPTLQRCS